MMSEATIKQGFQAKKQILIVEDHPVLRLGLISLIESEADLAVCAEASTSKAAFKAIQKSKPDLVIVDLGLERGDDGLDLVKNLKKRHPEIPALVLTMQDEAIYAERSLRAGAKGFLTKQQLDATVLTAIRDLLAGKTYMSSKLKERLAAKFVSGQTLETDSPLSVLSDRELQVFRLIGEGKSTRRIAKALHLSIKTIESHREHIKNKLAIENAPELAQRATQWVETGRTG